jgi:dsDNA-specific endonuclease/ATPase MutS2
MTIRDWLKRRRHTAAADDRETVSQTFEETTDEPDPFNPFPDPITLEIQDVFDLHTIAPHDVKRVIEEYLIEARDAGFEGVRIIHGKGKGVQRQTVRTILARTPFVEEWADAPPQAGGMGATIVRFTKAR